MQELGRHVNEETQILFGRQSMAEWGSPERHNHQLVHGGQGFYSAADSTAESSVPAMPSVWAQPQDLR